MQFFDELPEKSGRIVRHEPVDWAKAKAEIIAGKGQWGLMAENVSTSTIDQIRGGKYKLFRGEELGKFEFATRKPKNPETPYPKRRTDLYARYLGEVK